MCMIVPLARSLRAALLGKLLIQHSPVYHVHENAAPCRHRNSP